MDIYAYAESIDYLADYMDMTTGYIYKITEAKNNDGRTVQNDSAGCSE